jgi:hypothetical protein
MFYITTKYNQSIWDLAIQEYGDSAGVKQLIIDNPDKVNFSDDIPTGTRILISQPPINKAVVDYLKANGSVLATGVRLRNWILAGGSWDDNGAWDDASRWRDGSTVILSSPPPITE